MIIKVQNGKVWEKRDEDFRLMVGLNVIKPHQIDFNISQDLISKYPKLGWTRTQRDLAKRIVDGLRNRPLEFRQAKKKPLWKSQLNKHRSDQTKAKKRETEDA